VLSFGSALDKPVGIAVALGPGTSAFLVAMARMLSASLDTHLSGQGAPGACKTFTTAILHLAQTGSESTSTAGGVLQGVKVQATSSSNLLKSYNDWRPLADDRQRRQGRLGGSCSPLCT
jgi:hypothetical protein